MSWDELPATITTYLTAHEARDVATAITAFTADAVVTDEGHTYRGRDDIGDWLRNAASGFTFTTEFVGGHAELGSASTSCNTWKGTSRAGSPTCTSGSPWMVH